MTFRTPATVLTDRCRLDGRGLDALLSENTRLAKRKLETGLLKVLGLVSREGRWGWDGACLETVSGIAHDPINADINLYRYCGDNPAIYVDPTGLADQADEVKAHMTVSLVIEKKNAAGQWVTEASTGLTGSGGYDPKSTGWFSKEQPVFTETLASKPVEVDVSFWEGDQNGQPTHENRRVSATVEIVAYAKQVAGSAGSELALKIKNVHIVLGTRFTGLHYRDVGTVSVQVKSDSVKPGMVKGGTGPVDFKLDKNVVGVASVTADISGTITCYKDK